MANEIYHNYPEGYTLYAIIHRQSDDKVYDVSANGWEAWVDANIDKYDIPMTDHDGDYYSVDFPAAIADSGTYRITVFMQAGASPDANNDTSIAQGELHWDGTAEIDISTISAESSKVLNVYGPGE